MAVEMSAEDIAALFSERFFARLTEHLFKSAEQLADLLDRSLLYDVGRKRFPAQIYRAISEHSSLENTKLFVAITRGLVKIQKDKLVILLLKSSSENLHPISALNQIQVRGELPSFITISRSSVRLTELLRPYIGAEGLFNLREFGSYRALPSTFIDAVREVAITAMMHAVDDVSSGVLSRKEIVSARLTNDPSLNSSEGSVEFTEVGGRLSITEDPPDAKIEAYRSLLSDTLEKLLSEHLLRSMHNPAPDIENLLRDYAIEINKGDNATGELVWLKGNRIQQIIDRASERKMDPEFGPLPEEAARLLAEFVATHNLYAWCFPRVRTLIADLQQAQAGLRPFGEQSTDAHYRILRDLAASKDIFDARAEEALSAAVDAAPTAPASPQPKGLIAIVLGLARGCLQRMTKLILGPGPLGASAVAGSILGNAAYDGIKSLELLSSIKNFLLQRQELLITLAQEAPSYFGWLRYLLQLLT